MTTTPTVLDITQNDSIAARGGDKLKRRVAFVTGGTRGIGAAICRSLASQGAVLAAGYAGNDDAAKKFRDGFATTYGTEVSIHKGNVGEAADCRRTIDEVIGSHGRLDILVNNAGITIDKTVLKLSDEDWFKVLNVNLSGAFFLSQSALRHMAERGSGRIVNVASVIGEMGNIGQANYAASKSGLFGLTKTLAREAAFLLAKAGRLPEPDGGGLPVNTVTPGCIATGMREHLPAKLLQKIVRQLPPRRPPKPQA